MKKLIIIPAFNEENSILDVVNDILINCKDYDYIIINDCSTDSTKEVCKSNNVNVINLPINLGIGGCMQTGYMYAHENNYDIAVQVDGDGQHDISYIKKLEEVLVKEKANLVIGSRFLRDDDGFKSTFFRRIGIAFINTLIRLTTRSKITDCTSGFRICDKKTIDCFSNYYPKDYPEPESIAFLLKNQYIVKEIDVKMKKRLTGKSSIRAFKTLYFMFSVSLSIMIASIKSKKVGE